MGKQIAYMCLNPTEAKVQELISIFRIDYSVVNPDNKWKILRSQSRFALWGKSKHPLTTL